MEGDKIMDYDKGDSVYFRLIHKIYDLATDAWGLANPDDGYPKITIKDSSGATKIDAVEMSGGNPVGKFEYTYQLATDAPTGKWTGYVETSNSTFHDKKYFAFGVK